MHKLSKSLLFLVALTPLFIDKLVFIPSISAKNIFFRTIIIIVSILFTIGVIFFSNFRNEIIQKIKTFFKNPLFISIFTFILLIGVSTIFAFDKYVALWGTLERGEGLSFMIYAFSFLSFLLIFFEKKDYINLFKLNLFVTAIVLIKEFIQFFSLSVSRPDSFFGNPTFLAGYLIFSIMFSIILLSLENKRFWKYFSIIILVLSILGVFLTQTRGTILGVSVGLFISLIYAIIKGKNINYGKINLRKISIIILCLIISFSVIFFTTRKNEIWQRVPGLSRIALIDIKDSTTNTRLITQRLSLKAIDPKINGYKNLFIGYGQDNFSYAYGKYFDPIQFEDEMIWFDRAHNKFLDVLVMNGILGLISYLSIFIISFIYIFKKKEFSLLTLGITFGITAYLIHLFFIFDQITTYVPLFILFAFIIYMNSLNLDIKNNPKLKKCEDYIWGMIILFIFIIFSIFIYFRNDITAYIQMRKFTSLLKERDISTIFKNIDDTLYPMTTAQFNIRKGLFTIAENNINKNNKEVINFSNISLSKGDEYLVNNPLDFVFRLYLANNYTINGRKMKDNDLLVKGESHLRKVVDYTPYRPDVNYMLAINLYFQKKYDEAFIYFEKSFDLSDDYCIRNRDAAEKMYTYFIKYFYQTRNKDDFIKTANRLNTINYSDMNILNKIIEYIEKNGTWPNVSFQ